MTKKELQKLESKKKKELRKHKASRVPITRGVVKKDENCVDRFDIPKVITTDIGGKLLFGSIFAGYMQDSQTWRYK
jgi:hypothetical protein